MLYGTLAGLAEIDATGRLGLPILAAVLLVALVVERVLYGARPAVALRALGFGRPAARAFLLALAVSVPVLVVPAVVAGVTPVLRPGWPWLLVGIFAFHGLAEDSSGAGTPTGACARIDVRPGRRRHHAAGRRRARADRVRIGARGRRGRDGRGGRDDGCVRPSLGDGPGNDLGTGRPAHDNRPFKLVVLPPGSTVTFSLVLAAVSATVPLLVLAVPRTVRSQNRDLDDADR